jgi:four helix bundle protein
MTNKMQKDNIIQQKSFDFALRIINLYKYLIEEKKEFILSKQILRSGTSIGANIEEGQGGQTKKDFHLKMTIAYKEARETLYWLKLLTIAKYIDIKQSDSLITDCEELLRIIGKIQITTKSKL